MQQTKTNKKNNRYNCIQLLWLKIMQPVPWVITALTMIALTKSNPPNCDLVGLLIFWQILLSKPFMSLIALLVNTELWQVRGLDGGSYVDRYIYISAPRAATLSVLRSAGRPGALLACCIPYRTLAAGLRCVFGHMPLMLLSFLKGSSLHGFLQFSCSNSHREVFVLMLFVWIYFVRVSTGRVNLA